MRFTISIAFFREIAYNNIEPKRFRVAARISCTALGQGNYQDASMLGRASRPHRGDKVSPRRGLNIPATYDARKGITADSQHKTATFEC